MRKTKIKTKQNKRKRFFSERIKKGHDMVTRTGRGYKFTVATGQDRGQRECTSTISHI